MRSALPAAISAQLERLERAVMSWAIPVTLDHAIKWVLQFDQDDYVLALRIIENINVLGQQDVRSTLEVAQAKLLRAAVEKGAPIKGNNTLYAGVGQAAKSGAMMAYHYRISAELSENDFFVHEEETEIDFSRIDNIVLVDDVIGTGKSVTSDVTKIAEEIYSLSKSRNIYVLTAAGYQEGIQAVVKDTGASVICGLEYSSKDTVADLDSPFFDGLAVSDRSSTLERIKRYSRLSSRSDLGYGGVGGLLVFDHNTPNTTIPLIWARGNGWIPLFPRAGRVHGAAKVLKQAEAERRSEGGAATPTQATPERNSIDLTLFVEGKLDEIFVDVMRNRLNLSQKLGVKDVNAVALGGLAQSTRLFELLKESKKYAVFIFDGDHFSTRLLARTGSIQHAPSMTLKPTFTALLDLRKIYGDVDRLPFMLPPPPPEAFRETWIADERWVAGVEQALFKRAPIASNSERIAQLIEEYIHPDKYAEFVAELSSKIDQLFP